MMPMRKDANMYSVQLSKLIKKMKLEILTTEVDITGIKINHPDVNRPALQLAGYFDHFDTDRVQVIGFVEHTYLQRMENKQVLDIYSKLMDYHIPCVVICRDLPVEKEIIEIANKKKVPLLRSKQTTSSFMAELIRWLNVELAPRQTIHGVLVDVYGEGLLITGESGIGKSEAALELVKRGHRLISDDVVEIKKVSDETLIGSAPDITRHFIELRGIGIIDVKTLFGVESVKDTGSIDLVVQLEEWDKTQKYDRLGIEDNYIEMLGNEVVCHAIPIRPGRNLAVICESAAVNHRQKKMGYNAAQELYNRVTNNIMKKDSSRKAKEEAEQEKSDKLG